MTIGVEVPYIRFQYSGPGDYSYSYKVYKEEDLVVTHQDTSGLVTPLQLGIDYTVTLNSDYQGGTCHLTYAATEGALEVRRVLPIENQTDWVNNDAFNVELLEQDMDRLTMMMQQLEVTVEEGTQTSSWRGEWISGVQYYTGDNITEPNTGNIYICKVEHISGASFSDDLAAGYWALTLDVSNIKDAEQNAIDAANAAAVSETNAKTSETNASNSEQQALQSAQAAANDADRAEYWATQVAQSLSTVPVGHIMAWLGGYFTDSSNGNFTDVLGNPQAYLAPFGYRVCDGSEYENAASPIFNQPGRFLPNLTDDRFLMGSNIQGQPGGANTMSTLHSHTTQDHTLTVDEMPNHHHPLSNLKGGGTYITIDPGSQYGGAYYALANYATSGSRGGDLPHNHGDTGETEIILDNVPRYLSVIFAMKTEYGAGPDVEVFLVQPEA